MHALTSNPVMQARHLAGLTQDQLGKKLDCSKQYISRAELGTYTSLSKALTRWTAVTLDMSLRGATRLYEEFQLEKRLEAVERVNFCGLSNNLSPRPGHEVFKLWRENYWETPYKFAVDMCVHPSSVNNYEEDLVPCMPEQIRLALNQVKLLDPNWSETAVTGSGVGALRATLRDSKATGDH